ncbi:MAG: FdtA/QdtA family cupin domain-containing protein [Bacteroidales bacterium]|nr:FdtA/QdtA family cupin domain-containing protein [Bacteroidales bacterium]
MSKIKKHNKISLKVIGDDRGSLIALESLDNIPFEIKRVYYIYATRNACKRGLHAHKKLRQMMVCVHGSCKLLLDDGHSKEVLKLNRPDEGVMMNEMMWREMFDFSDDCVLMVLASEHYLESDYIRDYDNFIKKVKINNEG